MRRSLFMTIGALALASCASSPASPAPAEPAPATPSEQRPGMHSGDMAAMCPMKVEGTSVTAADVEGGVALSFTTSGDVAELRSRVARMAKMHGDHGGHHGPGKGMHGHQHGGAGAHRGKMMGAGMMMPAATARSEDVDAGARVVLTPKDPADLGALREHAQHMAGRMASGECPMMERGAEPAEGTSHEHDE